METAGVQKAMNSRTVGLELCSGIACNITTVPYGTVTQFLFWLKY